MQLIIQFTFVILLMVASISCNRLSSSENQILNTSTQVLIEENKIQNSVNTKFTLKIGETIEDCGKRPYEDTLLINIRNLHYSVQGNFKLIDSIKDLNNLFLTDVNKEKLIWKLNDYIDNGYKIYNEFPFKKEFEITSLNNVKLSINLIKNLNGNQSLVELLEIIRSNLLIVHKQLLYQVSKFVGCSNWSFISLRPFLISESQIAYEGEENKFKIFVGVESYQGEVEVEGEKFRLKNSLVEYKVKPVSCIDDSICRKSWSGVYKFKTQLGEDTLIKFTGNYYVKRRCK